LKYLLASILLIPLAGCVGTVGYYDRAADDYSAAVAAPKPVATDHSVRYVVNFERRTQHETLTPVSVVPPEYNRWARGIIKDTGVFKRENIHRRTERPDYYFIFNVTERTTGEPGTFTGILIPFFRTRETIVRLHVLDSAGRPAADFVGSGESFYARHTFLLPATPFYWPGASEFRAQRNAFRAVAVKAIAGKSNATPPAGDAASEPAAE